MNVLAMAERPIDVSAHLDVATNVLTAMFVLVLLFFVVRPELWRRLCFDKVDARPAGLLRIGFGLVVLWTFVDLLVINVIGGIAARSSCGFLKRSTRACRPNWTSI